MLDQRSCNPSLSSEENKKIQQIRLSFLQGQEDELLRIRPIIRESWLRCRQFGVDPHARDAPLVLSPEEVERLRLENQLCRAGEPVLRLLEEALYGPFIITITDPQSKLLEISGDPKALRVAERLNSFLGSEWSEHQVGTEASSLSSTLDSPVQVHWSEHYCELLHDWA